MGSKGFFFAPLKRARFETMAIDPPWRFASNSLERPGRNATRHYRCMTIDEIAALPVAELAADNCRAYLWVTAPLLAAGAHRIIFDAWNFRISTIAFVWVKTNRDGESLFTGMGYESRQNAEFVVLARRGRPQRLSRRVHSIIVAPRREHSRKPDEFYTRVEALAGSGPKADLFSRERRSGWEAFGDERDKFDRRPRG